MKALNREVVKNWIRLAPNVEEADKVIDENYNFKSFEEKIAFLNGMFDVKLVSKHDSCDVTKEMSVKMDYFAMLDAIINT